MAQILDADAGTKTPLAKACLSPVEEAAPRQLADERVAAAECLLGGGLVAAAARQRTLAAPGLAGEDRMRNARALTELETLLGKYRAKLEASTD